MTRKSAVAVVGATGHTARFVVEELLRRDLKPIAIARNLRALEQTHFSGEVLRRCAIVDDPAALDSALDGAAGVINCAGPFVDTADAVAAAAIRAGAHYVDISAEEVSVRLTMEKFDGLSRQTGVVVMPSVGIYGGFGDLIVTAALGDWDSADTVELMIGLDSWHPTLGTRNTFKRIFETAVEGNDTSKPQASLKKPWDFGAPLGRRLLVEFSFSESFLIRRHIQTSQLCTYLSDSAISDVSDPATPPPQAVDAAGRSAQRFAVEAIVARQGDRRRIIANGADTYAFTAPLVCEVVERLLEGRFSAAGAHTPGEIFDARDVLTALSRNTLIVDMTRA